VAILSRPGLCLNQPQPHQNHTLIWPRSVQSRTHPKTAVSSQRANKPPAPSVIATDEPVVRRSLRHHWWSHSQSQSKWNDGWRLYSYSHSDRTCSRPYGIPVLSGRTRDALIHQAYRLGSASVPPVVYQSFEWETDLQTKSANQVLFLSGFWVS
jgi:hypothetical protein